MFLEKLKSYVILLFVRHDNVKSIKNRSTGADPTIVTYDILLPLTLLWRKRVNRKLSIV